MSDVLGSQLAHDIFRLHILLLIQFLFLEKIHFEHTIVEDADAHMSASLRRHAQAVSSHLRYVIDTYVALDNKRTLMKALAVQISNIGLCLLASSVTSTSQDILKRIHHAPWRPQY
jgi:hypothetical protein